MKFVYEYKQNLVGVHSSLIGLPQQDHDLVLSYVLKQNECFEILNNKRWICIFNPSTDKCKNGW